MMLKIKLILIDTIMKEKTIIRIIVIMIIRNVVMIMVLMIKLAVKIGLVINIMMTPIGTRITKVTVLVLW